MRADTDMGRTHLLCQLFEAIETQLLLLQLVLLLQVVQFLLQFPVFLHYSLSCPFLFHRLIRGNLILVYSAHFTLLHLVHECFFLYFLLILSRFLKHLILQYLDMVFFDLPHLRVLSYLGFDKSGCIEILLLLLLKLFDFFSNTLLMGHFLNLIPNCLCFSYLALILNGCFKVLVDTRYPVIHHIDNRFCLEGGE